MENKEYRYIYLPSGDYMQIKFDIDLMKTMNTKNLMDMIYMRN